MRTLGNGRAATAELVEASWKDGTRKRYVEKVFSPGLLTRLIYRVAFAAPFAYRSNRHAILASFYRRRVVAQLLEAQAICGGTPSRVDIAQPAYVRYDHARNAWILAAEFIEGRGPIPRSLEGNDAQFTDEMSDLIGQMKRVESQLIQWGLVGSGWQVSPGAWVSTANLLIPRNLPLRVFPPGVESEKFATNETRYTIIDLESGIPAVLLWRYLRQSWRRGSLFPFDDLDSQRLKDASEQISDQLLEHGDAVRAANLRQDVAALIDEDRQWKAAEIAPFRKPWTLLRSQRWSAYRQGCIDRWRQQGSIDANATGKLQSGFLMFAVLWLVGALIPGAMGRWLQACIGSQQHRRQFRRFVQDPHCREVFWTRYRNRRIRRWRQQERCSASSVPVSRVGFLAQRLLGGLTPARVHRYCVDSVRRNRRNRQVVAFFTRSSFQAAWGRRIFCSTLARWQSRDWLTSAEAMSLRSQFDGPRMVVYSRGFTMHLAIKLLYPLITPLKAGGIAVTLAGGSLWYAIVPLFALPVMRTMVSVVSMWKHRAQQIPHGQALCVGAIPTLGSAAFVVQMGTVNRKVSLFLLRDSASRLARRIPVYGGPDSRTEHVILALTDRLIDGLTKVASILSKYRTTMSWHKRVQTGNEAVNVGPSKRLWWPYPNVIRDACVITAAFFAGLGVIGRGVAGDGFDGWIAGENGVLETMQLLILAATVIVGILVLTRTTMSSWRTIGIALACIAFAGAIREIPNLESLPRNSGSVVEAGSDLIFAVPRSWKHVMIMIAATLFFARAAYAWFAYPGDRKLWFSPSFVWPVIPFSTCFVMAESFEHSSWAIAEESTELLAYTMMLMAAVWVVRNAKQLNEAKDDIDRCTDGAASIRLVTPLPDRSTEDIQWRRAA